MLPSRWSRAPRPLLALFVAATVLPAAALGWLGWRLFDQDRALQHQRIQERLEHAADLAGAALLRHLSAAEDRLADLADAPETERALLASQQAAQLADDALLVVLRPESISANPAERLVYYPDLPNPSELTATVFANGERLEFIRKDLAGALSAFRRAARSTAPEPRAGALMRVARVLRKLRQPREALAVYDELARLGSTPVAGLPAALVARHGRCAMLDDLGRRADLEREATALDEDLLDGRWPLARAAYQFYANEAARWMGADRRADATRQARAHTALALAAGVASLWDGWQDVRRRPGPAAGRRMLFTDDGFAVLLWRRTSDRLAALVATASYAERSWFRDLQPLADRQRVRLRLAGVNGEPVAGAKDLTGPHVRRAATDTQLPWTLLVASADPAGELNALASRRRLLLAGLAALALLVLSGSYVIARGVSRELDVARLQSDFVAAVSHEFRTPLASMRQLSELLAEGRVRDERRRDEYYAILRRESERLQRLVEGLLDFGRMEAGAKEYRFERLEPGPLVRGVAAEFAQEVAERGYGVEVAVNGDLPAVRADREALGRAIWNLLDNAVKYSPACKTVRVEAGARDRRVAIRVRDEGLGITAGEQDRIFTKFARGTSAQAADVKGTGLGLAMVRHIVRAHGGEIRLDSEPGRGSTFTILLPTVESRADL